MKKLILLFGMLILCFVPFWKQQWEERWDHLKNQKKEKPFACGTVTFYCGTDLQKKYSPSANGIDGEALFKANCAACHYATDKKATGPGLWGVFDRIPGGNWKYDFIRDSEKMIQSGDAYSNALYKSYNEITMTKYPDLTNEEIDEILIYCNQ